MGTKNFSLDVQRLLALIKNPSAGLALRGAEDFPYGVAGAGLSIIGFFLWVLSVQHQIDRAMSFFSGIMLGSLYGFGTAFKFLLLALLSLAALAAALTLVGNRFGQRKRAWIEVVTHQGASQLMFGLGYLVSALVAFISLKLSFALTGGLLLLSLLMLVIQALELHEVDRKLTFPTVTSAIVLYVVLFSVVWVILF
ncbi:hypothetical protein [Cohnella nanjingensis]|uniref:Yip1 domain-containing protein n=1 Tax=Cohnella nanjingensis TaxID=1387779 RepID=A0A7X0RXR4_9BACL|nr:hypothetical protein [Cohnella nanjingensis]MBB6675603.1 hypothetical protein [Cohnella nanjingensis]